MEKKFSYHILSLRFNTLVHSRLHGQLASVRLITKGQTSAPGTGYEKMQQKGAVSLLLCNCPRDCCFGKARLKTTHVQLGCPATGRYGERRKTSCSMKENNSKKQTHFLYWHGPDSSMFVYKSRFSFHLDVHVSLSHLMLIINSLIPIRWHTISL